MAKDVTPPPAYTPPAPAPSTVPSKEQMVDQLTQQRIQTMLGRLMIENISLRAQIDVS